MAEESKTIGFRLETAYHQRLAEEAKRLGIAPGTLVRRLVVEALEDRDRGVLRFALSRLEEELVTLRGEVSAGRAELQVVKGNLRNAALRLLTVDGPLSAAEANKWAEERLKR